MNIKDQINQDLKTAMLAGEKNLVTTLRGLKSAILYAEVSERARENGLDEQSVVNLLQKEAKKRQESADMYIQGGNKEKAAAEEAEKNIIQKYLPAQLTEVQVRALVESEAIKIPDINIQKLGQLIGAVKKASNGAADGALVAQFAKEYLSK